MIYLSVSWSVLPTLYTFSSGFTETLQKSIESLWVLLVESQGNTRPNHSKATRRRSDLCKSTFIGSAQCVFSFLNETVQLPVSSMFLTAYKMAIHIVSVTG